MLDCTTLVGLYLLLKTTVDFCGTMPPLTYGSADLLAIKANTSSFTAKLPAATWSTLKEYNLCYPKPTHRGVKGGQNKHRPIPVLCNTARPNRHQRSAAHRTPPKHLVPIPKAHTQFQLPKLLLSNTRALTNKLDELSGVLQINNVDIAIITESWLSSTGAQQSAGITGYTDYHKARPPDKKGGGVAVYTKDTLPSQPLDIKVPDGLECLWLRLTPAYLPREISSLVIAAVYHPPKAPNERQLMDHIAHTVSSIKEKHPHCGIAICGDFNRAKITSLCSKGMKQIVRVPTRGQAVLDLIITDIAKYYKAAVTLPPIGKSDHNTVLWEPDATFKTRATTVSITSRPLPDSSIRQFGQWITAYDWRPVMDATDTQTKTSTFYSILHEQIGKHFPTRNNKRHSNDKPWVTDKIRSMIRRRQDAYKRGKENLWKSLRNSISRAITQAKLTFTDSKLSKTNTADPQSWFSTIKQIGGMGKKSTRICLPGFEHCTDEVLATAVNEHFSGICSTLPALDTTQLPAFLPAGAPPPNVTRSQVLRQMSRINVHKAPGPDSLPNRLLKEFAVELSEPVCSIINSSLQQGTVPSQWKCATVVPVPKINPPPNMDKLRPVSLTPTLAKVAETFVSGWMMEDMAPQLDPWQFGNRKGRSTNHYLVNLVQHAFQALEDGYCEDLLAIDYSKAFDRVDITIALNKLLQMNVRRELLPWVGDFLSGRKQQVRTNGATSDWRTVTCGVPQGTKLGPVVFLAMVNEVAVTHNNRWKFVDDITLATRTKASTQTDTSLQHLMLATVDRAKEDHMAINTAKCATMRIALAKDLTSTPLSIDDTEIPHVTSMKLLGVTIQSDLKWDQQVEVMITKASTRRYFISVLKRAGVKLQDLIKCYCTFIRPLLEYATPVWHPGLTREQSEDLEQIQRQCLRTLLPDVSYREALTITGLQRLEERREQLCMNFGKKLLNSNEFNHWLPSRRGQCHQRSLRNNNMLNPLPSRTRRFDRSPMAKIVKLLNTTI